MNTRQVTPWGRGALGPEHMERLRLHLTPAALTVLGRSSDGPFTVRIHLAGKPPFEAYHVGAVRLWDVIVSGLESLGIPLPSDEDWAALQAQIEALA